jgi:hypothetical protein
MHLNLDGPKLVKRIVMKSVLPLSLGIILIVLSLINLTEKFPASAQNLPQNVTQQMATLALEKNDPVFTGADGPYVFEEDEKSLRVVRVRQQAGRFVLDDQRLSAKAEPLLTVHVDNAARDSFAFRLQKKIKTPPDIYRMPAKLLAISDIEGNFDAFYSLLVGNGVMDKNYRWTFGKNHLVLVGDFVDRGANVIPVLWLIYHLEQEARKHGGFVHFLLGNHEQMNLTGDVRYVQRKYIALAQYLSGEAESSEAYGFLMGDNAHLANWLRSKNVIEKIGDILFVHGGLSEGILILNADIPTRIDYP